MEFLADDLLEGRGAGSQGHALAANYVAAQFRQLGLAPGGAEKSYFQSVPLLEATPVLPGSAAHLARDGESIDFEYSTDYLPSADFSAPTSSLTAPLAFAGFGVTAPERKYDDFANIDVQGRIVVIFGGAPAKFPHDQRAYYSWQGSKFPNLIAHGAVGVITVDTPEDAERTPWEKRVNASWQPQMRWLDADNQPADAYGELKQRFRFSHQAAAKLFRNAAHSLEETFATAAIGEAQGFLLPGSITLTATTGLRRNESNNVVAVLAGSDPKLKNEYIVFSAHLDHLGRGKAVNGDSIYNGAHDNAVGSAILIEVARMLAMNTLRPKRSIIFLAVTAEEKGLLGSDYFANHPIVAKKNIVANFNIDMPLPLAPTRDFVAFGAEHSTIGPVVARAAQTQGYALSPDNEPAEVHFIRSDQFSFIR
ncbi:MAG TPA: M28 family metallopeptidase, partial [Steroidobacteraceae bacterium]|nr:M28 family metallopeptidase [Steroidobacteraceae bacterium]